MGWDLEPVAPSENAPRHAESDVFEPGEVIWGRYNIAGWQWLVSQLQEWGVDTSDFSGTNDGDFIPPEKCREVADAIEAHLHELSERHQNWLRPDIALWRTCGGYRQW